MTPRSPRRFALTVMLASIVLTGVSSASAQFNTNRVIQRAIDVNTRAALQRIQVSLKVKNSAGSVVVQQTSRDGRYLLLVFEDNRPRIWDLETGRYWDHYEALGSDIVSAAIDGDQGFITVGSNGVLAQWDGVTASPDTVTDTPLDQVVQTVMGRNGEAILLDAQRGFHRFDGALRPLGSAVVDTAATNTPMALDPSGDVLAGAIDANTLKLWDVRTGTPVATINTPEPITAYAFGSESRQLLIATPGGVLDWDTGVSSVVGRYPCTDRCVLNTLLINPVTQSLIAANESGGLLRWPLDSDVRSGPADIDIDANAVSSLSTTATAPVLIGGTTRGLVQFSHLERTEADLTLVSTDSGWAMIDPLGRFDGDAGQESGISWGNDRVDFPLPSFVDSHYEPGLFGRWLRQDSDYFTTPNALTEGVLAPPGIEMTLVPPAAADTDPHIEVQLKVTDSGGGLGSPSLYHLGLRVSLDRRVDLKETEENGKAVQLSTWRVRALRGENTFTASVRDGDGVTSPARVASLRIDGPRPDPALHLLTIAIDDYGDSALNLNYSIADSQGIAGALSARGDALFSQVTTTRLSNAEATRDAVLRAIRDLKRARPEDVIVIYAATHGEVIDDRFHLLLHGLRAPLSRRGLNRVGLAFDDIAAELEQLDARRVMLLLDTCKSGDALADLQSEFRDRRALQSFSNLLGVHMIAATAKGQLATESEALGHGVFTYSMIEGLSGRADVAPTDGRMTASELANFTEAGVPALSARYAAFPQWPTIYALGFDFGVAAATTSDRDD